MDSIHAEFDVVYSIFVSLLNFKGGLSGILDVPNANVGSFSRSQESFLVFVPAERETLIF